MTNSASATSRISFCRMSRSTICRRVYDRLAAVGLATPNAGLVTDIISCPGLDYCALATARSIPIAQRISERFGDGPRARRHRAAEDQDLRLHQRLRPPSRRPHRHSRPREIGRRDLSDHARRLGRRERPRSARSPARASARKTVVDAIETIVDTYLEPQRTGRETSSTPTAASAWRRSRRRSTSATRIGHLMGAQDIKLFGDADRGLAARDVVLRASRRRRFFASRSRICFPAASRWSPASAPIRRRCCTWSRRSTKRRQWCSSTPASIFPETLAYRDALVERLGLTTSHRRARRGALAKEDPENFLFATRSRSLLRDPQGFAARQGAGGLRRLDHRSQSASRASTRARMPLFEAEGERIKVNPLAGWSAADILELYS